jgi:hypothetical protein
MSRKNINIILTTKFKNKNSESKPSENNENRIEMPELKQDIVEDNNVPKITEAKDESPKKKILKKMFDQVNNSSPKKILFNINDKYNNKY